MAMATWPRIQDHDIDVIYLEVTRSKCRFLTRWTHPFRRAGWAFGCVWHGSPIVPCLRICLGAVKEGGMVNQPRVRSGPIGLPSKGSLSMEKGLGPGPAKRSLKSRWKIPGCSHKSAALGHFVGVTWNYCNHPSPISHLVLATGSLAEQRPDVHQMGKERQIIMADSIATYIHIYI